MMDTKKTLSVHFDAEGYEIGELVQIDTGDGPETHVVLKIEKSVLPEGDTIKTRIEFAELSEYEGKTREGLNGTHDR